MKYIGKKTRRVDGYALAKGKPVFTDDIHLPDLLYMKILHSITPHAIIKKIDVTEAMKLDGMVAVYTHKDFKPHYYTTAGQGYPEPSPRDTVILDKRVRYVGDRVAIVVAEKVEIAEKAIKLIQVDYEELPPILHPEEAIENEIVIHPEKDLISVYDASNNIVANIATELGNVDKALKNSKFIFEGCYSTPYVQQAHIEPHITLTWFDENQRLVIRTATQVPFHVRRIVSDVLDIPIAKIRVIKPRIGGGFGGKQEILNEEICAAVTLKTGRPARIEYTREEEFFASRSRHPQIIKYRIGVNENYTFNAIDMNILQNCGAYGTHSLTVMSVTASKTLSFYKAPNIRVNANSVYTNLPPAGAYRGYGSPQGFYALECLIDEIACDLGIDPVELRHINCYNVGDEVPIAKELGEGSDGYQVIIRSSGLRECLEEGKKLIDWEMLRNTPKAGVVKRGVGVAAVALGSGIAGIDMGSVFIKMNEDASFNLNIGATDLGTGSDTALAQIAAEILDVPVDKIIVYSSDTDLTPFDTGAYASSTTFISGSAVKKAAEKVRQQILDQGKKILGVEKAAIKGGFVIGENGEKISYQDICTKSFYTNDQMQIMATASHLSYNSPPPFNATFADVSVDMETGLVKVNRIVSVTDAGQIINPQMAEGQVEGAIPQSLGHALSEFMIFDDKGKAINTNFNDYHIFTSIDMPEIVVKFIHTDEPSGPFGAKALAEIPITGPAPAVTNAIFNACGVRIRELPITPEKILMNLR